MEIMTKKKPQPQKMYFGGGKFYIASAKSAAASWERILEGIGTKPRRIQKLIGIREIEKGHCGFLHFEGNQFHRPMVGRTDFVLTVV